MYFNLEHPHGIKPSSPTWKDGAQSIYHGHIIWEVSPSVKPCLRRLSLLLHPAIGMTLLVDLLGNDPSWYCVQGRPDALIISPYSAHVFPYCHPNLNVTDYLYKRLLERGSPLLVVEGQNRTSLPKEDGLQPPCCASSFHQPYMAVHQGLEPCAPRRQRRMLPIHQKTVLSIIHTSRPLSRGGGKMTNRTPIDSRRSHRFQGASRPRQVNFP